MAVGSITATLSLNFEQQFAVYFSRNRSESFWYCQSARVESMLKTLMLSAIHPALSEAVSMIRLEIVCDSET